MEHTDINWSNATTIHCGPNMAKVEPLTAAVFWSGTEWVVSWWDADCDSEHEDGLSDLALAVGDKHDQEATKEIDLILDAVDRVKRLALARSGMSHIVFAHDIKWKNTRASAARHLAAVSS